MVGYVLQWVLDCMMMEERGDSQDTYCIAIQVCMVHGALSKSSGFSTWLIETIEKK